MTQKLWPHLTSCYSNTYGDLPVQNVRFSSICVHLCFLFLFQRSRTYGLTQNVFVAPATNPWL
jgi:hypothetical protein